MKIKTLLIAAAVVAMATGGAFAQSSGTGSSGTAMSQPSGTGPTPAQKAQMQKDKSPASTSSGAAQEK
jgi:hypothetical protein